MSDKYIENIMKKVSSAIESEKYFIAGQSLYLLTKYAIVIGDDTLVFLSSELADVFRNCFLRLKEFEKDIDKSIVSSIISTSKEMLNIIIHKKDDFDSDTKIKIFDDLTYIISNGERIQEELREIEESKNVRIRRFSSGIL